MPELLDRLASVGLGDLPPSRLSDVAEEAWSWGVATADARYCVLWRTLDMVDGWWQGGRGGVGVRFVNRVSAVLRQELPDVLSAGVEEGCALASAMHDRIVTELNLAGDLLAPMYRDLDLEDEPEA
jgi:hypothetical protein